MISYKPLFKTMIDKDITREKLRERIAAAPGTMSKLYTGKRVALEVLERICLVLEVPIQDIIEILPDKAPSKKKSATKK